MRDELQAVLDAVQVEITRSYTDALTDGDKNGRLRDYIEKCVLDGGYSVWGLTTRQLIDRLYDEMARYSILTPYLSGKGLEELNINSWDDIVLTDREGRSRKLTEHFFSPEHAVDIVKRLLRHSGMVIDNAKPIAQGHLPGNARITAIKTPIVAEEVGIAASIRFLHPQEVDRKKLLTSGIVNEEMLNFLESCVRYGVSLVVAGRTSSGKTTLLNALLESIPNDKRIFGIESGAREFALVKRNCAGRVLNNVVLTLSRQAENGSYSVSQENLVCAALRFDPDVIAIGEIRDEEASAAVEASLTGHTVVTTVHSGPAERAHSRMSLLCQRRFELGMEVSLRQTRQAFPIVVFTHKCEDNIRRVMDISECIAHDEAPAEYRCLYRYRIDENQYENGNYTVSGAFERVNEPSPHLRTLLLRAGIPWNELTRIVGHDA